MRVIGTYRLAILLIATVEEPATVTIASMAAYLLRIVNVRHNRWRKGAAFGSAGTNG